MIETIVTIEGDISSGGASNYKILSGKPSINNVELNGNLSLSELGIKQEYKADDIPFDDGETFQEKYDSGELKGERGVDGQPGERGPQGPQGVQGVPGNDYVLTDADKREIASIAVTLIPSGEEVSY